MRGPLLFLVLDGFGYRQAREHNAIAMANTPHWDGFWQNYPHTLLDCSGQTVGLPEGQMGNSEVGHMHIGAGRVIDQDLTRISKTLDNDELRKNATLRATIDDLNANDRTLHLMGLLSPGGVHSHEDHLFKMITILDELGLKRLAVHVFLDGRDTPPSSALPSIERLENVLKNSEGHIHSVCGRFYAMDRDKRWDRTKLAYDAIVHASSDLSAPSARAAVEESYEHGETDEFVKPTVIEGATPMQDGDAVLFMNFRADRARQLCYALFNDDFTDFSDASKIKLAHSLTLTDYARDMSANVLFPPLDVKRSFGELVAEHKLRQLRIAESEKYAHVTFFFNGGREEPFELEERCLIPSPKVATYDLKPEMSAHEVTDHLVDMITNRRFDVIIGNYANADMVGHSGNMAATIKAIECLDECLGRIHDALKRVDGEMVITADHGNAEMMFNETSGHAHTAHTSGQVPLVYVGPRKLEITHHQGSLIDIAPTLCFLCGWQKPAEMTGTSLFKTS